MGSAGEILVYQQLYNKLGTLICQVDLTLDPNKSFLENRVTGTLSWSKPATTGTTYPTAFEPINQDCDGAFMANGPRGSVVQGLPFTTASAALRFDEDGSTLKSATDPDVPAFTLNSLLKPVLPAVGAAGNLGKATLTLDPGDGTFRGAFTLEDNAAKRTVSYEGLLVRPSAGQVKGVGHYLAVQPGSTQKLSGTVSIEQ
jgi:hypothetical protein